MKNIINLGKALILGGGLIFGGQGLEASSQNCSENYGDTNNVELIRESSKNEIVINFTKYEEVFKLNKEFKDSEAGRQLIEFYGSKEYIRQYKDKMNSLGRQDNVGEMIVQDKIERIVKSLEEDIKKDPDNFGFWNSNGEFVLDHSKVNEAISPKVKYEFLDYYIVKGVEKCGGVITRVTCFIISTFVWRIIIPPMADC